MHATTRFSGDTTWCLQAGARGEKGAFTHPQFACAAPLPKKGKSVSKGAQEHEEKPPMPAAPIASGKPPMVNGMKCPTTAWNFGVASPWPFETAT